MRSCKSYVGCPEVTHSLDPLQVSMEALELLERRMDMSLFYSLFVDHEHSMLRSMLTRAACVRESGRSFPVCAEDAYSFGCDPSCKKTFE